MVPLQRERDLNTAARIGQSLVKQNSVLMEENSKLEAMLGSAREEVTGRGGGVGLGLHPSHVSTAPVAPVAPVCLSAPDP